MWIFLGILISAVWLGAVWLWFERDFGLENLAFLLPGEIGQFLAGIAAPLALLWIVIAMLHNGRRLGRLAAALETLEGRQQQGLAALERRLQELQQRAPLAERRVERAVAPQLAAAAVGPAPVLRTSPVPPDLRPLAEEAETLRSGGLAPEVTRVTPRAAESADEGEGGQPLDAEFRGLVKKVARDLNAISMDLSAVLCRKAARDEALKGYNRGQKEAFYELVRDHLAEHAPGEILGRLSQADAQSLLHTYAMKFAALLDEAGRRDASGAQEQALRRSAMGRLYDEVQRQTASVRS